MHQYVSLRFTGLAGLLSKPRDIFQSFPIIGCLSMPGVEFRVMYHAMRSISAILFNIV